MIITHRICYPRSILKDVYCHRGRNLSRLFPKLGKREKSKRSAQDYNEIKRRLGKQNGDCKYLNLLDKKCLPTLCRLV